MTSTEQLIEHFIATLASLGGSADNQRLLETLGWQDGILNMKKWWNEKLANDPRWIVSTTPQGNANFAWLQHMLWHLAPTVSMALLLANGSMSSNTNNEGEIRKRLTAQLAEQFAESATLEMEIKRNLANLGYGGQQS